MPAGTFGRGLLGTTGAPVVALASNPDDADFKTGGVTIDWSTVTAVGADTTLPGGDVVLNGRKYLRFGQIIARANTAEAQTVTYTGGPTGGGAIIGLPALGDLPGGNTASISATATAAQFEAAVLAVYNYESVASVGRTGSGTAGDPYIYTVTFGRRFGDVTAIATVSNTFTGGTTPSVTIGTTTAGTGTGYYGPYDPSATDGRQTLTRGECFILNETVLEVPPLGWGMPNTTVLGGAFDGGNVWKDRIIMTAGTHSLTDGPTISEFETAFPRIEYTLTN